MLTYWVYHSCFVFPTSDRFREDQVMEGRFIRKERKFQRFVYPLYVESDQANLPMIILRDILYRCDMSWNHWWNEPMLLCKGCVQLVPSVWIFMLKDWMDEWEIFMERNKHEFIWKEDFRWWKCMYKSRRVIRATILTHIYQCTAILE